MTNPETSNQSSATARPQNKTQYGDPLAISSSDHPGMQLTSNLFNGQNTSNWTIAVKMALGAKDKSGFIDGSCPKPSVTDVAAHQQWVRCDYMVRCWLLNSMTENISAGFMYSTSAKQLWEEIAERYGQANGPLLFQLKRELSNTSQGSMSMADYFSKLKTLWDEIDNIEGLPECSCGVLEGCSCGIMRKIVDMQCRNRTIQFLMGVNEVYDTVRTHLLSMEPMFRANKAFSLMLQAEQQRHVAGLVQQTHEISAFNMNKTDQGYANKLLQKRDFTSKKPRFEKPDKSHLKCGKCNKKGHTSDTCFYIHGFPEWYKGNRSKPTTGKFAGQVTEYDEFGDDHQTPLDPGDAMRDNQSNGGKGKMDTALINVVVQEVTRIMKGKQQVQESSNNHLSFAGPHF